MEERTERNPLGDADAANPLMRPSVARAVREMRSQAPMRAANGIFKHPSECTEEERNFIADCLKRNIPLYTIAGMIHCERSFLSRYIRNHPELQDLKDEQHENIVDEAEYQLDRLNKAGNASTIIFTLQTKGRKRGWTTEDIAGDGGGQEAERIVMGVIPDEDVKAAEAEREKLTGKKSSGGVLTDPVALAAMEQLGKEVKEYVDRAVEDAKPEAIDAESAEVGEPPYAGDGVGGDVGTDFGMIGDGGMSPAMDGGFDPWAAGGDSPFAQ